MCDIGNTDNCICKANYVEESAVCTGEYIGTVCQTFESQTVIVALFIIVNMILVAQKDRLNKILFLILVIYHALVKK